MAGLIYLASPYSHNSHAVRYQRYLLARRFAVEQISKGVALFSPIVYGKDMETQIGTAFEPWANLNDSVIRVCDEFWVLMLRDWKLSRGIQHELALAESLGKPITFIDGEAYYALDRHDSAR